MCVCGYIFVTITNAGSKAAKVSTCMKVQNTLLIYFKPGDVKSFQHAPCCLNFIS